MGGPHVTELPEEALGHDGGSGHADAVALGEADQIWPIIVADAEQGVLQKIYVARDRDGKATSLPWRIILQSIGIRWI